MEIGYLQPIDSYDYLKPTDTKNDYLQVIGVADNGNGNYSRNDNGDSDAIQYCQLCDDNKKDATNYCSIVENHSNLLTVTKP